MVVAADHVRDAHVNVVHDVREMEHRRSVRAHDHEILRVFRLFLDRALDQIGILETPLFGHAENHALAAAALVVLIGKPAVDQFLRDRQMPRHLAALVDRRLVVVQPQPAHTVEQRVDRRLRRALAVRVLHPQQKLAAGVPREQPIKDGGADIADMDVAGGTRRETDSDGHL